MKQVSLDQAKTDLAELVREIEETGAEVVILRNGRPAARISAVSRIDADDRRKAVEDMLARRDARGDDGFPADWEEFKAMMREGLA